MSDFSQVYAQLRRKSRGQYALLAGCCFCSTLLITAYVLMMRSPTVLTVLPEGGDSRKQVMMIFALTMIGCGVFTAYASGLFFRYKSRECGVFLALGATKGQLGALLRRELTLLSLISCGAGMTLGGPLAWLVWQLFRKLVVDSAEMVLSFDIMAYFLSLAFSLYVLIMLFWMLHRFLRRANILDIIRESHTSEPVRVLPRWCGILGIVLTIVGVLLGYLAPSFFILRLHWYPPEGFTAIFYLPALVGLYMILLHTVVNGWRMGKSRYTHLITTSMMRFQGKQTVLNLLVVTLLVGGAYFASFYTPIIGVGALQSFDARAVDYAFHYREDQNLPTEEEIRQLAAEFKVNITDFVLQSGAVLAYDGMEHVETEGALGTTYHKEYREMLSSCTFLSESAWNALTGEALNLASGTVVSVFDGNGQSNGRMGNDISLVTNPLTGQQLSVKSVEPVLCSDALFGRRVLDDSDYAALAAGLPHDWQETEVLFNVKDVHDTYPFAKALFNDIVDRSGTEVELYNAWEPVEKMRAEQEGEAYFFDRNQLETNSFESIDYDQRDSSNFRLGWKYMPQFRVLDKSEFVKTTAVYLMLFIFIALLCFAAVFVILFTRCMTIALNNAHLYSDLRHLGASDAYLYKTVKKQFSQSFFVPIFIGTSVICAFYSMILYFNDGMFSVSELSGFAVCVAVIAVLSAALYGWYRLTLRYACRQLKIGTKQKANQK